MQQNPTDSNRIQAADAAAMVSRWAPQLGSASPVHLPRAGHGEENEVVISTVSNQHTPTQVVINTGDRKGDVEDDEFSAILRKVVYLHGVCLMHLIRLFHLFVC
jgi:hypothetical protein